MWLGVYDTNVAQNKYYFLLLIEDVVNGIKTTVTLRRLNSKVFVQFEKKNLSKIAPLNFENKTKINRSDELPLLQCRNPKSNSLVYLASVFVADARVCCQVGCRK